MLPSVACSWYGIVKISKRIKITGVKAISLSLEISSFLAECGGKKKIDSDYNEGRQSLSLLVVQTSAEVVL